MNDQTLREIVSKLCNLEAGRIVADTPLNGNLSGSLGRARLDAAIRQQFSISTPRIYSVATYGELCQVLGLHPGSSPTAGVPARVDNSPISISGADSFGVGIDLQSVSMLPEVADYWEDHFYKQTFTSQEIAYALLQEVPRQSLAAMWCAKEAVRKAHKHLLDVDWNRVEVLHAMDGKPYIQFDGQMVDGALSLSHTEELAIAVFVSGHSFPFSIPKDKSEVTVAAPAESLPKRRGDVFAILAILISVFSLVLELLRR